VTVKSGAQVTSFGLVDIDAVGPGLFTPNYSGQGPPVASVVHVKPDSSQTREYAFQCGAAIGSCVPAAIDMGPETDQVFLELYGTGIRGAGSLAAVSAKIGGVDAPVQYAGAQSSLTGVDQVNVQVPRSLKGRGQVDLVLTVAGKQANTVKLDFQ